MYTLPIMGVEWGQRSNHTFRVGEVAWEQTVVPSMVSGLGAGATDKVVMEKL